MKEISIIGVGLIGGSLALDIKRKYPEVTIKGIDASKEHLNKAIELNIIDAAATYNDLQNSELVILAIPVDVSVIELPKILDAISDITVVVDVGSTKTAICAAVEGHTRRRNFLAAHPIAGTEYSGPTAAIQDLFVGKTNIVCEVEKTAFKLQQKALKLFDDIGMHMRYMNPEAHDKHIAYVSHLSHISSFMLGKTVIEKEKNERDIFDLAGSGFESTVRLAKSSPAMWAPIFKQNKYNVIDTLNDYIDNLKDFKNCIEQDDFEAVFNQMEDVNHIKEILNGLQ